MENKKYNTMSEEHKAKLSCLNENDLKSKSYKDICLNNLIFNIDNE